MHSRHKRTEGIRLVRNFPKSNKESCNYDWEIRKERSEAVAEIEEMGREADVPVNTVLLQGHPAPEERIAEHSYQVENSTK